MFCCARQQIGPETQRLGNDTPSKFRQLFAALPASLLRFLADLFVSCGLFPAGLGGLRCMVPFVLSFQL